VAGLFVLGAVPLSVHQALGHLSHYANPRIQRHAIRVIMMVPVYALESWLAMRFEDYASYIETAREAYEALAVYSFFKMMEEHLAVVAKVDLTTRKDAHMHHMFPFTKMKPWPISTTFLHKCRDGIMQYVIVKLVVTLFTLFLMETGYYAGGSMSPFHPYLYVAVVTNVSQTWAMYCLILFYHSLEHDLELLQPFPKLLCIKAVVFFTFWQSMIIEILGSLQYITAYGNNSEEEVADMLDNLLICIEMFLAAVAHEKYYSFKQFQVQPVQASSGSSAGVTTSAAATSSPSFFTALRDLSPVDMLHDARKLVSGTSSDPTSNTKKTD